MVLSDQSILHEITYCQLVIRPLRYEDIQPASVDIHLDKHFRVFRNTRHVCIDVREPIDDITESVEISPDNAFIIHPGEFALAGTDEYIELPNNLVGRLEGKSSLGRLGLLVHATAGYVDPGWKGRLTLELSNVANLPIKLYHKMKIGQISFEYLTTPADRPYGHPSLGSKYQGDMQATASRFYKEFT